MKKKEQKMNKKKRQLAAKRCVFMKQEPDHRPAFIWFLPYFSLVSEARHSLTEPGGTPTLSAAPSNAVAYHNGARKEKGSEKEAAPAASG